MVYLTTRCWIPVGYSLVPGVDGGLQETEMFPLVRSPGRGFFRSFLVVQKMVDFAPGKYAGSLAVISPSKIWISSSKLRHRCPEKNHPMVDENDEGLVTLTPLITIGH